MSLETSKKTRRRWIWRLCALAILGVLVFIALRRSGDTVTFRVVDRATGTPLSNVTITVFKRWPPAVRNLPFPTTALMNWRQADRVFAHDGVISIPGINRETEGRFRLRFDVPAHSWAVFVHDTSDQIEYYQVRLPIEQIPKTNLITIPLPSL